MLNVIAIVGNLTRDPEVRFTPNGTAVCNLSLACNRRYKAAGNEEYKEEVCFVSAVVWGKRAENCGQQLHKGNPVFITGRLQSRSWEKDGQKRSTIEIVADDIQFLNRTKEGTSPEEAEELPSEA
jgi:single-strand DNA-binding protein